MAIDYFFNLGLIDFPNSYPHVSGYRETVHTVDREITIPDPSTMSWKCLIMLKFLDLRIINPNLTAPITAARRKILFVLWKFALQNVLIAMRLLFLHGVKVLSSSVVDCARLRLLPLGSFALPKAENASGVSHYKLGCISGYLKACDRNWRHVQLPEAASFLQL
jgi:hypothetical protein